MISHETCDKNLISSSQPSRLIKNLTMVSFFCSIKYFHEPTESTSPMLQLIEVISFSYPNLQDIRLSNVDMGIDMGTCVAIVGPNDTGKSPLPNLLAGDGSNRGWSAKETATEDWQTFTTPWGLVNYGGNNLEAFIETNKIQNTNTILSHGCAEKSASFF